MGDERRNGNVGWMQRKKVKICEILEMRTEGRRKIKRRSLTTD